jgi:hypothetical protein
VGTTKFGRRVLLKLREIFQRITSAALMAFPKSPPYLPACLLSGEERREKSKL